MKLEEQVSKLAELGLPLAEGVTVDDLLYSFGRESFESRPFGRILFLYGVEVEREPWGRPFCRRVWNFDTECVTGSGAYVAIARRLAELTGRPDALADVADFVDLESGEAWLKYTVKGTPRHWPVEVNDDWADMMAVSYLMDDLEGDGKHFYSKDNGQAMILFFLDPATAAELNRLSGDVLKKFLAD